MYCMYALHSTLCSLQSKACAMTLSVDLMVTLLSKALQLHKYCSADSDASLHEILLSSVHVSVLVDVQSHLVHLFSVCVYL